MKLFVFLLLLILNFVDFSICNLEDGYRCMRFDECVKHTFLVKTELKLMIHWNFSDTPTTDYFNGQGDLKVSLDQIDCPRNVCVQLRKPSLTKIDSIDIVDCEYTRIFMQNRDFILS